MLERFHQQSLAEQAKDPLAQLLCAPETGVLLLSHGSRQDAANQEWEAIWQMFRQMHPQLIVQRGYIEFCQPSLEEGVALLLEQGIQTVVIVPLFLTTGKHLGQHIPAMVDGLREKYPSIHFLLTEHIGPDSLLLQIIEKRIRTTGLFAEEGGITHAEPDQNADR